MIRRKTSQILARRNEIAARIQAQQAQSGISSDLYWARLDTLCQTLPWAERTEREAALEQGWYQWIGGAVPEGLLDYYNEWMHAFYLEECPRSPNLMFLQMGSLMAKMEWGTTVDKMLDTKKMLDLCMNRLAQHPKYETLTKNQQRWCERDLLECLSRYTTPEGICTETVRTFFLENHARYEQALRGLLEKMENQEVKTAPITETHDPAPLPVSEETSWEPIQADPDMVGLCAFLEKTSSAVYQRSLAQLYTLYQSPCTKSTGKLAQMALRDFFSALRALRIEPVDENRFRTDFPEEYAQELRWRNGSADYVMTACGWSCNDILVIRPIFQKKFQEGDS